MLDYKYIEQILDKFFECDTTLEEEKILRTFFSQNDVPESLAKYKELFVYQQTETANNTLGEDFDEKMMRLIEDDAQAARKPGKIVSLYRTTTKALDPFIRAAAIVAVIVTMVNASQVLFEDNNTKTTGVANIETVSGKNMADVQKTDSLIQSGTMPTSTVSPILEDIPSGSMILEDDSTTN